MRPSDTIYGAGRTGHGAWPFTRPFGARHVEAERRRIVGAPVAETKKADPQRESPFNSGSGGRIRTLEAERRNFERQMQFDRSNRLRAAEMIVEPIEDARKVIGHV